MPRIIVFIQVNLLDPERLMVTSSTEQPGLPSRLQKFLSIIPDTRDHLPNINNICINHEWTDYNFSKRKTYTPYFRVTLVVYGQAYDLSFTCLPSNGSTSLITVCVVLSLFTRRETYAIPTLKTKGILTLGQSFGLSCVYLFYPSGKFSTRVGRNLC